MSLAATYLSNIVFPLFEDKCLNGRNINNSKTLREMTFK